MKFVLSHHIYHAELRAAPENAEAGGKMLAIIKTADDCLEITREGKEIKLHNFWLRDHCRCNLCYNKITNQINFDVLKIPDDVKIGELKQNAELLTVVWCDGHVSEYSTKWLSGLDFKAKSPKTAASLWDKAKLNSILDSLMITESDYFEKGGSARLLKNLLIYGIGFVTNVDATMEKTREVAERLAFVKKSYFGEMWEVANYFVHKDTAYTTIALGAHNDNTYFSDAAGLQVFHMLSHDGDGGETLLVDGFNAANNLKLNRRRNYEVLCETPVEARYIESDIEYSNTDFVIKTHPATGELHQIRYNIYDRGLLDTLPQNKAMDFYTSYKLFGGEINHPDNQFWLKLQPGTVCFIDNWRVLHGRASYTGLRKLVGCYIGRDDWLAKAKGLGLI